MNLKYQAQALQDKFVAKILNYKRDGYYLDIGSCDAVSCNNTYAFEELGWKGICVEIDPEHSESYNQRTCHYIKDDALKVNYALLFETLGAPKRMDYLSLDVDAASTDVLKKLPLDEYIFSVITVEHDFYIHSGIYRDEQRRILKAAGYVLYAADVLVPLQNDTKENSSFEDWWAHSSLFSNDTPMYMEIYPKQIIEALG